MTNLLSTTVVAEDGLIRSLLAVLILAICAGAIYFVGRWFLARLTNATALTVWDGFFLLVGLLIVVNFLLGLIGHPLVAL